MTQTTSTDRLLRGFGPGELACFAVPRSLDDFGPKSSIALHIIHQAVIRGVPVLYINMESTIDDAHFKQLGLDNK